MDTKLEVIVIPVRDVDRSVHFYKTLGWRLDADATVDDLRVVQLTPPGSQASVIFGTRCGNGPRELRLVGVVQRSGRQHLVPAGDHDSPARTRRPGHDDLHDDRRSGSCTAPRSQGRRRA
jgi:catechol 2,3-dioxygenase-like lactoylglutathione lyase family enzyme